MNERLESLLTALDRIDDADHGSFPYDACRRLTQDHGFEPSLIPDLDLYLSEIAGHRSWRRRMLQWPDAKIAAVEDSVASSFFDRFPAYGGIRNIIDASELVELRAALERADQTRGALNELLAILRNSRG